MGGRSIYTGSKKRIVCAFMGYMEIGLMDIV
jgi:hypothetical protein